MLPLNMDDETAEPCDAGWVRAEDASQAGKATRNLVHGVHVTKIKNRTFVRPWVTAIRSDLTTEATRWVMALLSRPGPAALEARRAVHLLHLRTLLTYDGNLLPDKKAKREYRNELVAIVRQAMGIKGHGFSTETADAD